MVESLLRKLRGSSKDKMAGKLGKIALLNISQMFNLFFIFCISFQGWLFWLSTMLNCRFFEEAKTIVSISSFSLNSYQYQITSACFEIWLSLHVLTCLSLKAAVHFPESASIKRKHEKLLNSHFSVGVAPASQCFNTCFTKTVPMLIYKSF